MPRIELTRGQFAIVDEEDSPMLRDFKWHAGKSSRGKFYAKTGTPPRYMHRMLMGFPAGVVDHINGDTLDNRRENLRVVSHFQNGMNRTARADNPTGRKGVRIRKNGYYMAEIRHLGKSIYLGRFRSIEAAGDAYDAMAKKLHGEFYRS